MASLFIFVVRFVLYPLFAVSQNNPAGTLKLNNGSGARLQPANTATSLKKTGTQKNKLHKKIDSAFLSAIFMADTATQAVYFEAGQNENGPLAYVSDVPHHDIRSEGMSYGMMIAVQLNKKQEFDAIWNYALSKMYISSPAHPSEGYFSWSLKT